MSLGVLPDTRCSRMWPDNSCTATTTPESGSSTRRPSSFSQAWTLSSSNTSACRAYKILRLLSSQAAGNCVCENGKSSQRLAAKLMRLVGAWTAAPYETLHKDSIAAKHALQGLACRAATKGDDCTKWRASAPCTLWAVVGAAMANFLDYHAGQ